MCVPLPDEERGLPVSALSSEGVRRPDGLRYLRAHDRELAPPCTELPPFVPSQDIQGCVSTAYPQVETYPWMSALTRLSVWTWMIRRGLARRAMLVPGRSKMHPSRWLARRAKV